MWNAGSTGDGGDVLWGPFLAVDGSPREENRLLSELSVDVRGSGDVKRREMPRERSRCSFRVDCREVLFRNQSVSANITMRDLDLGATVHDVWRLGSVANGLLLFRGIRGRRRHHCSCPHCTPTSRLADVQPPGTELRSLELDEVTAELDWRVF